MPAPLARVVGGHGHQLAIRNTAVDAPMPLADGGAARVRVLVRGDPGLFADVDGGGGAGPVGGDGASFAGLGQWPQGSEKGNSGV